MDELIKILELSDDGIEQYVTQRLMILNSMHPDSIEVSMGEVSGEIYKGWLNTNCVYLPSGIRSKGFVLTKQFYSDWCHFLRQIFEGIDIHKIKKTKQNEDNLIEEINVYQTNYFGYTSDNSLRKEIYGYGQLNSIGKTLNIEILKDKNVARCIEKSAGFNGIANFMGFDCSLVLSFASDGANTGGHAYCFIKDNEKYKLCDPNFLGSNNSDELISFIFDMDINSQNNLIFDSGKRGDLRPVIIEYYFPWNKFNVNQAVDIKKHK